MGKIIKITPRHIFIADDSKNIIKVPNDDFYDFEVNDYVEVYQDGEDYILTAIDTPPQETGTWKEFDRDDRRTRPTQVHQNIRVSYEQVGGRVVNQLIYVLIAFFLGAIGGQKFYSGRIAAGVLSILFCWTYIPTIIAIVDIVKALTQRADENGNIVV